MVRRDRTPKSFFCRVTQVAFLRLLTNKRIAEACGADPVQLRDAWDVFDRLLDDPRVGFLLEPSLDAELRRLSDGPFPSSNLLPDAYLVAFANAAGIALATFDQAFSTRGGVRDLVIIE
jgi:predicted nucleic acid-binding protein